MELVIILAILAVLGVPVLAIVALVNTSSLKREVEFLARRVSQLGNQVADLQSSGPRGEGPHRGSEQTRAEAPEELAEEAEAVDVEAIPQFRQSAYRPWVDPRRGGPASPPEPDATSASDEALVEDGIAGEAETGPDIGAEPRGEPMPVPVPSAMDFETRFGTTWILRIGLVILAIALALFARNVAPQLSAGAKVAIAYLGAIGFFAAGKYWEERLERFARPVMAGGLAFGFFVAFAAHFVPAMQAVSLPVSLGWMVLSMAAVLMVAEGWKSQPTAGLAILLGHISAFVAAGGADSFSLILIGFLALTAIVLLLRHSWLPLGIFAVVVSYGSHLLWILSDRSPFPGDLGFWLNLGFLTSYYVIFLIADILWWRRWEDRNEDELTQAQLATARSLGPANLILYVSVTSFVFWVTEARMETIEWYYLSLGSLQGGLAWFYYRTHHRDFVFYPAFGSVLWTLGFFATMDALGLNLVLAGQGLLLLLVAHRTRLWVFHAMAQAALAVAFTHHLFYSQTGVATWPLLLGGMGLVLVYLFMASLEESWYGEGDQVEWEGSRDAGGRRARLVEEFSAFFAPLAPNLPYVHAAMGGIVLLREAIRFYGFGMGTVVLLSLAQMLVVLTVSGRRRIALLAAHTVVAVGSVYLALGPGRPMGSLVFMGALTLSALILLLWGIPRLEGQSAQRAGALAQGTQWIVLLTAFLTLSRPNLGFHLYLPWVVLAAAMFAFQELASRRQASFEVDGADKPNSLWMGAATSAMVAFSVTLVTVRTVGVEVATPVWIAGWTVALMGAAALWRSRVLFAGGYALMVTGYLLFVVDGSGALARGESLFNATLWEGSTTLWEGVFSSWWAGAIVTVVPLALAMALDHISDPDEPRLTREDSGWAGPATYGAYVIACLLVGGLGRFQLPPVWSLLAPTLLALFLIHASSRLRTNRSVLASVVGVGVLHLIFFQGVADGDNVGEVLLPVLLFAGVTLAVERRVAKRALATFSPQGQRLVEALLVVLSAQTAMVGIYGSTLFGTLWATAGWTGVAALLMGLGFGLKSSIHRRIALGILGVCLLRVFLFDMRGLSGTAQTGAFFVLGLCLVGVAWLYARFSNEIKNWL